MWADTPANGKILCRKFFLGDTQANKPELNFISFIPTAYEKTEREGWGKENGSSKMNTKLKVI